MGRTWCLSNYKDNDSEIPNLSDNKMAELPTTNCCLVITLHKDTQQKGCEGESLPWVTLSNLVQGWTNLGKGAFLQFTQAPVYASKGSGSGSIHWHRDWEGVG